MHKMTEKTNMDITNAEFLELTSKVIAELQVAKKVVEKLEAKVEAPLDYIKQECKNRGIIGQDLKCQLTNGITIYEQKSKVIARSDLIKEIEKCEDKLADAKRLLAEFDENGYVENTRKPVIKFTISKEEKMFIDARSGIILTELMKKTPSINQLNNIITETTK